MHTVFLLGILLKNGYLEDAKVSDTIKMYLRFVVDKVALGQVFSEYFDFPCRSLFHQFLHNHHHYHLGLVQ
jgi:hypothetical protein